LPNCQLIKVCCISISPETLKIFRCQIAKFEKKFLIKQVVKRSTSQFNSIITMFRLILKRAQQQSTTTIALASPRTFSALAAFEPSVTQSTRMVPLTMTTTRIAPSVYYATQQNMVVAELDSATTSLHPKFSAICDRCGFEPSTNCRTCDDVLLESSLPLNDEPWNNGPGTAYAQ